jgi:hypothetical protein
MDGVDTDDPLYILNIPLMMPTILVALVGVGLVFSGIQASRRRSSSPLQPEMPIAKIEDGRPLSPPPRASPTGGAGRIIFGILLILGGSTFAAFLYAIRDLSFKFGRPLRVNGRPRLCRRRRGTGSHDDARPSVAGLGAWRRVWLGERWLTAARAEHASVPAFAQLGAQLAAVGAPAALVARCEAAAADEVRHARRCFAISRTYAGIDWAAGAMPAVVPPPAELPTLAVESLVDGCVGEGIAADYAYAGAARATDPVIRSSLEMIARDEAEHAELAWAVIEFCVERDGAHVRAALADAIAASSVAPRVSPGPIELDRATRRRIAAARMARVHARLAPLVT